MKKTLATFAVLDLIALSFVIASIAIGVFGVLTLLGYFSFIASTGAMYQLGVLFIGLSFFGTVRSGANLVLISKSITNSLRKYDKLITHRFIAVIAEKNAKKFRQK